MAGGRRPLRRRYLDDFQPDAAGKYHYSGRYYRFAGTFAARRGVLCRLSAGAAVTAAVIGAGCLDTAGMDNAIYVLIPYMADVVLTAALWWSCGRLLAGGDPLREYVYTATVRRIPRLCAALAIACGLTLVCAGVYLMMNGFAGRPAAGVEYVGLIGLAAAAALFCRRTLRPTDWKQDE